MADRASAVAHIRLNPVKVVGYVAETINFTALATDYLGRTVQGVRFSWEESDLAKNLQIDDSGRATFLQAGIGRVTCRVGSVVANAAVLIRASQRPVQSDADWRADQASLGSITISSNQGESSIFSTLMDRIAPTAYAQSFGPYVGNDLAYDQLWSEPRNLVGSPRNRAIEPTALGTVLPESSNFNLAIPLVGLQGRGIASSLTLYSNSRVWGRHGTAVTFDPVASWPSPGFSLGFGRVVTYDVNYYSGTGKLLLVEPDGTRRYLGSTSGYCACQTNDGSHIKYSGGLNGGSLYRPDGTVTYFSNVNNRLLPTSIIERNGSFILIAYRPGVDEFGNPTGYSPYDIDYITDSLGRIIQFWYDATGHLNKITVPGFGGTAQNPVTQTLVWFDYETRTLGYSFSGLTVENIPNYGSVDALKHVYFPATGTGYLFTYSSFGMAYSYSVRRGMDLHYNGGWPPQPDPTILDGVESANVTFNYPTTAGTVLTDAPAFSQRTETAVNSPQGVYNYSTSTSSQTLTFTITRPDSTTVQLTRSTDVSSVANGRLVKSEIKNGAASLAKTELTYVNDPGGSPKVQSVTSYDDTSTPVKMDFDYDVYGNVTNKREYGYQISGSFQVRRRTHFTYRAANLGGSSLMPGLPTLIEVFDAVQNTNDADDIPIAKSSYEYDNYSTMDGMEDYGGTATPPGHFTAYNSSYTDRGNVTTSTQWTDIAVGATIQHMAKYDIFGSVVKAQVSCCQEKDITLSNDTYFSLADSEMSGNPTGVHQITSTDYDFNTSLPASATDAGGLVTSFGYNAALNPSSVVLPTGASASAGYNYGSLSSTKTISYSDMGALAGGGFGPVTRSVTTTTYYDGWGRVIKTVDPNNAQVNIGNDNMGRVVSRTNPFTAGGTPGPATTFQYDLVNKAVITTLPGGNTVRNDYSGSTITATDQVGRKIKRETDGLGRLIKVTEQDVSSGALTQETTYTYNLLDKLTGVTQAGQTRGYKYDALGRLLYERIPEQSATINDGTGTMWSCKYTYTEFSAVATRKDARGVVTTYAYDALHRVWGIVYDTSGAPGVAATSQVTFEYTSWGAVSSVTMPEYAENYTFDSYHRPASLTRWLTSDPAKTHTTSYEYNGASQLLKMIYPSGQQMSVNHDDKGRTQSLTYDPGAASGYLTGLGYNIAGQVTGLTLGNGVAESYGYDPTRLQMTSQTATKGAASLMNLTYYYQASAGQMGGGSTAGNAGQLMAINNNSTINGTAESAAYTYDNLGRLVTSNQTSNGASAQRRFAHDRWGNRTGVWDATSGGNQIQAASLEQSGGAPTNRLQSVSVDRTNVALAANGATVTASSTVNASWPASAVTNGDRKGANAGNGGVWADATSQSYPDWIEVDFRGSKTINEIDVFTIQDNSTNPSEPTEQMTFTVYGMTDYQVQYWNGSSWQTVPGGSVAGNNKVWKKFTFADITTSKIRVYVTHAPELYSYVTEIEAYQSTATYGYDAAGNVINDGLHTYTYDAENRVVSVDGGVTAQYQYDHQNRRYKKTIGSTVTHYIWQGSQVIAEHDGTTGYTTNPTYQVNSARVDYIYAGSRMISSRERASSGGAWITKYYLSDRLSTRLVLDTSGNVLGRQAHLPFGEDLGESGTQEKHHFTSYERDGEAGPDYAVNRQYAQSIGRFSRPDPLSSTGKKESPQTWNRYAYATSDPINMKDPLGLFLGCVGCNPESFCGFDGPTVIVDGFNFTSILCDLPIPFPAPSNPAPEPEPISCTIQVFDRVTEFAGGIPFPGNRHGYIVFTVGLLQFYFEGRKVKNKLTAVDTSNPLDTRLLDDNPSQDRLDGQISGPNVCSWLSILQHDADVVNAASINYHWWGPNSSSVLRYMLESLPDRSWFQMPFMVGYGSRLPGIET